MTCKCEETDHMEWESNISPNMFCAALPDKHASVGDSGGPLVTDEGGYSVLIGVVSWGLQCLEPTKNLPGVYARVTTQLDWILEHISGIGTRCSKPGRKIFLNSWKKAWGKQDIDILTYVIYKLTLTICQAL